MKKLELIDGVILLQTIVTLIFAFGYTEFPVIEHNTSYLVIGLCIVGLGMYYLTYLKDDANHSGQEHVSAPPQEPQSQEPKHPHPLPVVGTSAVHVEKEEKDVFKKFNEIKEESGGNDD